MSELEVQQLVLGDLDTNCYLVSCPITASCLIIDPADSGDYLTDVILQQQLQPIGILLTHGHFDHLLGLLELKLNFNVPIMVHQADEFLIQRAHESATHWLKREVDPVPPADTFIKQGDTVNVGHHTLHILEVPGHTPGSIAVFNDEILFTGDTWFKEGVGATKHMYSSVLKLNESLQKLKDLRGSKIIYPGHGELF